MVILLKIFLYCRIFSSIFITDQFPFFDFNNFLRVRPHVPPLTSSFSSSVFFFFFSFFFFIDLLPFFFSSSVFSFVRQELISIQVAHFLMQQFYMIAIFIKGFSDFFGSSLVSVIIIFLSIIEVIASLVYRVFQLRKLSSNTTLFHTMRSFQLTLMCTDRDKWIKSEDVLF